MNKMHPHPLVREYHGCSIESTLCDGYKVSKRNPTKLEVKRGATENCVNVECDGWQHVVTPPDGKGKEKPFTTLGAAIAHAKKINPPPKTESRLEPIEPTGPPVEPKP